MLRLEPTTGRLLAIPVWSCVVDDGYKQLKWIKIDLNYLLNQQYITIHL